MLLREQRPQLVNVRHRADIHPNQRHIRAGEDRVPLSIFVRPEAHALSFVAPRMRVPKPLFVLHTQFAYTHHARHEKEAHFWLFAIYDKDETEDLSSTEKKALKSMLDTELEARQ